MTTLYNTDYHAHNQYPPNMPPSFKTIPNSTIVEHDYAANADTARRISRTPSPTPSEVKELKSGAFDWPRLMKWRFWIRKEWIWWYLALAVLATLTALMTIYHEEIVAWLEPAADWMYAIPFGWLIPIGVTIVLSFPPLFGQEIVGVLCGLVWGLWIGFAIFAGGTLLGEIANFYAFKYCCRSTGEKWERTQITYACLARVVREGGFKIVLAARLSAIPGHFSTAVCSICGTGIISFSIATILSLPKQFITVYLGVMIKDAGEGKDNSKSTIINAVVLTITFIITAVAMWYIYDQMNKVKPSVIYARRKARQGKLDRAMSMTDGPYEGGVAGASSSQVFNPRSSDSDIPLTHQQWDADGKATGYSYDPRLDNVHQPQPKRFQNAAPSPQGRGSVDVSWDTRQTGGGFSSSPQPYQSRSPPQGQYARSPPPAQNAARSPPPQSMSPRQYNPRQHHMQAPSLPPQGQGYYPQQSRSPPPQGQGYYPQQSRSPPPQGQGYYPQQSRSPPQGYHPQHQQGARRQSQSNNPYSPQRTGEAFQNPHSPAHSPRRSVDVAQTPTQAQFAQSTGPPSYASGPPSPRGPASPTGAGRRPMSPNNPFVGQQQQYTGQQQQQYTGQQQQPPQQQFGYHVQEPTDASMASYYTAQQH